MLADRDFLQTEHFNLSLLKIARKFSKISDRPGFNNILKFYLRYFPIHRTQLKDAPKKFNFGRLFFAIYDNWTNRPKCQTYFKKKFPSFKNYAG
jgi:hypothetical protein